jgi:sugar (pentulose or hexulose) kinase
MERRVGIDIGTTSVEAVVADGDGRRSGELLAVLGWLGPTAVRPPAAGRRRP